MATLAIVNKSGTKIADAKKWTYTGKAMGEESVAVTIESAEPIAFAVGDYLMYRNERYTIQIDPSTKKQCTPRSVGNAFVYDSVKFVSAASELTNVEFLDVVPADNEMHYTKLPNFSFFAHSIQDFADRLKANLQRSGVTWQVVVEDGVTVHDININVSGQTCWDVLTTVCGSEYFDTTFRVDGHKITIGSTGEPFGGTLGYGKGNGLKSITRTTDDTQKIVTRLRAYGSSTNMPARFYNNIGVSCWIPLSGSNVTLAHANASTVTDVCNIVLPSAVAEKLFFTKELSSEGDVTVYQCKVKMDSHKVICRVTENSSGKSLTFLDFDNENTVSAFVDAMAAKLGVSTLPYNGRINTSIKLDVMAGANRDKWCADYKSASNANVPSNMSVQNLMLPGFGNGQTLDEVVTEICNRANTDALKKRIFKAIGITDTAKMTKTELNKWFTFSDDATDPYIDSVRKNEIGLREASIAFDGSEGRDDIHPSMEWVGGTGGNTLGKVAVGSAVEDNGIYTGEDVPDFEVKIPNIGFDIEDYVSETPMLNMVDGPCGGRDFEITRVTFADNRYTLKLHRHHDSGLDLYFPYKATSGTTYGNVYQICEGNKFVLTGIEMPESYVFDASENELLPQAIEWLVANVDASYKYELEIDNLYMQREFDANGIGNSFYGKAKAGDKITFADTELMGAGISLTVAIDNLTISEGEEQLPKYEVTLADTPVVGTIQRLMNSVSSVSNAVTDLTNMQTKEFEMLANKIALRTTKTNDALEKQLEDIGMDVEKVKAQADQQFTIWIKDADTTMTGLKAEWTEDDVLSEHDQDIFYDREAGKAYRFVLDEESDAYAWVEITDQDTLRALEEAKTKKRVFVLAAGQTLPLPPYDKGDLWQGANWGEKPTIQEDGTYPDTTYYSNELLVCVVARAEDETPSINDWEPATSVTRADLELLGDRFNLYVTDTNGRIAAVEGWIDDDGARISATASAARADASAAAGLAASANETASAASVTANAASASASSAAGVAAEAKAESASAKLTAENASAAATSAAGVAAQASADAASAKIWASKDDALAEIKTEVKGDESFISLVADNVDLTGKVNFNSLGDAKTGQLYIENQKIIAGYDYSKGSVSGYNYTDIGSSGIGLYKRTSLSDGSWGEKTEIRPNNITVVSPQGVSTEISGMKISAYNIESTYVQATHLYIGGKTIKIVDELPAYPSSDTIYIVI